MRSCFFRLQTERIITRKRLREQYYVYLHEHWNIEHYKHRTRRGGKCRQTAAFVLYVCNSGAHEL